MKRIKSVFSKNDTEDTGYLDSSGLYRALQELKVPVQPEDIQDILESVGKKKEGKADLEDFLDIVSELKNAEDLEEDDCYIPNEQEKNLNILFQMLRAPNESGITLDSMLKVCAAEDPSWTKHQVKEMLSKADTNRDGIIDLDELRVIYKKTGLS
ncbi:hypothetical protein BY458DRAFT_489898 [Sporodiniella umbellata]|nr:hypothetical protein BY458DRAFT_489898 [Sporodiniella umbellata]